MLPGAEALWIVCIALVADAITGDPDAIWRRMPHPVSWIGKLIAILDRALNHESWPDFSRRMAGVLAVSILVLSAGTAGWLLNALLRKLPFGMVWIGIVASVLLAQNSLYRHVARVASGFTTGGLEGGRRAVSMIVGRDPKSLDEAGVCRAAIESTAENFSDGVVAPVFWLALLGLPGLLIYKAINTADSMIGHRTPRHEAFGWAAARLDDFVNLIPARLSGMLLACVAPMVGGSAAKALKVMWRDARLHRSPNAGWPEAAMAGALGLALAGPRRYGTSVVDDPFLNVEGRSAATPSDISRGLKLLVGACLLQLALLGVLAWSIS
ncbi:MAG: adenosylcobinamide-phosphate synthase CbiB [Bosea sp. (in: a-proteobacteria)]